MDRVFWWNVHRIKYFYRVEIRDSLLLSTEIEKCVLRSRMYSRCIFKLLRLALNPSRRMSLFVLNNNSIVVDRVDPINTNPTADKFWRNTAFIYDHDISAYRHDFVIWNVEGKYKYYMVNTVCKTVTSHGSIWGGGGKLRAPFRHII